MNCQSCEPARFAPPDPRPGRREPPLENPAARTTSAAAARAAISRPLAALADKTVHRRPPGALAHARRAPLGHAADQRLRWARGEDTALLGREPAAGDPLDFGERGAELARSASTSAGSSCISTRWRPVRPRAEREVERVAHLVLMQLLPALVEADLGGFGAALTEIQRVTGGVVRARAGRCLRPGTVRDAGPPDGRMGRGRGGAELLGTGGVRAHRGRGGRPKSRPGPAALVGPGGRVFAGGFAAAGARVWRSETGPNS